MQVQPPGEECIQGGQALCRQPRCKEKTLHEPPVVAVYFPVDIDRRDDQLQQRFPLYQLLLVL